MKKNYVEPNILVTTIKIEAGFAVSEPGYGLGTPGGDIGYDEYDGEL